MAVTPEMDSILDTVLNQLQPGLLQDAALQGLRHLFPDTLIQGALTLIDNEYVICYVLDNGRIQYIVRGSSASSYTCHPGLGQRKAPLCSCYAFIHSVLSTRTYLLCKHVLAVRIAIKMDRLTKIAVSEDLFANILHSQFTTA